MRRWRALGLALLAGAAASLGWGALQGDLQVALFLVFPVVYGSGVWGLAGIGLLMAAFVAFFLDGVAGLPGPPAGPAGPGGRGGGGERGPDPLGGPRDPRRGEEAGADGDGDEGGWFRGGGVIMLGPIPIVLGSDRRSTMALMALAVLLMAMGLAWWVLVAR